MKDRTARYVLQRAVSEGLVDEKTVVVESTSGNFGVALANVCKQLGVRCVCVVDPNSSELNRFLIRQAGAQVVMVTEPDDGGGYLKNRIACVKRLLGENAHAYWTNQYGNAWNWEAHYHTTGCEIYEQMERRIDFLFVAVSSGGTAMGCARYLKERDPEVKVIGVDVEGSVIFGGLPRRRFIPGIGSSRVPEILDLDLIDDVVHVREEDSVVECRRLLREESLFVGGSSGSVSAAVRSYFGGRPLPAPPRVTALFPDRGEKYMRTVYDDAWVLEHYPEFAPEALGAGATSRTEELHVEPAP